jgi:hypothetical protein
MEHLYTYVLEKNGRQTMANCVQMGKRFGTLGSIYGLPLGGPMIPRNRIPVHPGEILLEEFLCPWIAA